MASSDGVNGQTVRRSATVSIGVGVDERHADVDDVRLVPFLGDDPRAADERAAAAALDEAVVDLEPRAR